MSRQRRATSLGIDIGTTKIGVSVCEGGQQKWAATAQLEPACGDELKYQSVGAWLRTTKSMLADCQREYELAEVEAIGVTATTPTLVFLDKDLRAINGQATLWCSAARDGLANQYGTNTGLRILSAIHKRFPRLAQGTQFVVDAGDFVRAWLTSKIAFNRASLVQKFAWSREGGFDLTGVEDCGIRPWLAKIPSRHVHTGERVGLLRPQRFPGIALRDNTPVICAGYDTTASAAGGALTEPGSTAHVSVGTSVVVSVMPACQSHSPGNWALREGLVAGNWKVVTGGFEAGMQSIGVVADELMLSGSAPDQIEQCVARAEHNHGPDTYGIPFNNVAARAPFHCTLPFVLSVAAGSGTDKIGQLIAMRRGVCFVIRFCIDDLRSNGVDVTQIHLVGGGTKSASFCQVLASVCDLQVKSFGANAAAVGAALLAQAAQPTGSLALAVEELTREKQTFFPQDMHRRLYDDGYLRFVQELRRCKVSAA